MKQITFITMFVLISIGINAQTLEECRQLAREHYPEIKQYNLISQTEQYNLSNAAKAWLPQIALSGQATYQSATVTYPEALQGMLTTNGVDMTGIRKDQYKIGVDVSQNIWDGGQSKATKAIAKAEAIEQRTRTDVSLYDLNSRIDNIYFGILLLDERVEQTNSLIKILESNLARMQTYVKNGVAIQSDVDAIEAELLTAQQTLEQIKVSRECYRRMLELFIGQQISDNKLERPAMPEITSRVSLRPELALFDAQTNKIEAQRKAINTSIMPRISAFAQAYYGYPGLDMFKSMTSSAWTPNAIAGLRVSWNIGAFYTKENDLKKLDLAQQQIAVQRNVFLFNTQMQTTQDDGEIIRLRKAITNDKRIVELRHSIRIAAESKFENGTIDATDLLAKIADETSALLNQNIHELELLQTQYRLKTTLNQ